MIVASPTDYPGQGVWIPFEAGALVRGRQLDFCADRSGSGVPVWSGSIPRDGRGVIVPIFPQRALSCRRLPF